MFMLKIYIYIFTKPFSALSINHRTKQYIIRILLEIPYLEGWHQHLSFNARRFRLFDQVIGYLLWLLQIFITLCERRDKASYLYTFIIVQIHIFKRIVVHNIKMCLCIIRLHISSPHNVSRIFRTKLSVCCLCIFSTIDIHTFVLCV